ncbi:hypothetical protein D3C71_1399830 [compost metagenome]
MAGQRADDAGQSGQLFAHDGHLAGGRVHRLPAEPRFFRSADGVAHRLIGIRGNLCDKSGHLLNRLIAALQMAKLSLSAFGELNGYVDGMFSGTVGLLGACGQLLGRGSDMS